MARSRQLLVSTTLAFVGGFVSGLLYAPQTGRQLRHRIAQRMQQQGQWVETHVQDVEAQLAALETRLHATTEAFSERFREATGRTLETYIPTFTEKGWNVQRGELLRELRFLPRR